MSERILLKLFKQELKLISTSYVIDSDVRDKIDSQSVELTQLELELLFKGVAIEANTPLTRSEGRIWSKLFTKIENILEDL